MSQTLTSGVEKTIAPIRERRKTPISGVLSRLPMWVLIGLLLVVEIYPLLWLLQSSFKTNDEFSQGAFWSLPASLDWQNYAQAWTSGMGTYFLNSILTVFPALFLILVMSLAASFALQVMQWLGNNIVLLAFLAGIMIPTQMVLLPLF